MDEQLYPIGGTLADRRRYWRTRDLNEKFFDTTIPEKPYSFVITLTHMDEKSAQVSRKEKGLCSMIGTFK